MEKLKKIWDYLSNPPICLIVLSFILCVIFAALSLVFTIFSFAPDFVSYIIYCFAAIFLTYSIYIIVIKFKFIKNGIKDKLYSTKTTKRLMEDYEYRTLFFARVSLLFNIGYAIFTAVFGVLEKSIWYGALATYYIILSLLRYIITRNGNKLTKFDLEHKETLQQKKAKIYFACGLSMLLLDFVMIAPVVLMIVNLKKVNYNFDWFIFAIAAYTFYKVTLAIYNIFKAMKTKDRVIQSLKNITLADAGVSLLSLQVSLIVTFGDNFSGSTIMNIATGVVVLSVVAVIGTIMIINGRKELKFLQKENIDGRQ